MHNCHSEFGVCTNADFNLDKAHFNCACQPGSEDVDGDGTTCREIDECTEDAYAHNCGQFTQCKNLELSFECSCIAGGYDGPVRGLV